MDKDERKQMLSYMDREEKKLFYATLKRKIICKDCGKKLGKKSLEEYIFLCGLDDEDLIKGKAVCLRCGKKSLREFQDDLSEALFGEVGRYDEIDFDDFPGFRD